MEEEDTYRTILKPSGEVIFKDKNSKFFGTAFPISSEEDIQYHLEGLKKRHHAARHFCYAWQLGKARDEIQFRANDDGEPNNSAGMPIYGQLQSFEVTNILVVVVRYFGGIKLGMGGLIQAYKTTAKMTVELANLIEKTITIPYEISCDYPEMNKVMRVIKRNNLEVTDQKLGLDCKIFISVRKSEAFRIFDKFASLYKIEIKKLEE